MWIQFMFMGGSGALSILLVCSTLMFSHYQPEVASHPTSHRSLASDHTLSYTLCWLTWEHFDVWLKKEQHEKGMELIWKNIHRASPDHPWQE